jgi:hypothetical protein
VTMSLRPAMTVTRPTRTRTWLGSTRWRCDPDPGSRAPISGVHGLGMPNHYQQFWFKHPPRVRRHGSQVHTKLIVGHCEACVKNELSIVYPRSFWLDSSFVRWHAAILSA